MLVIVLIISRLEMPIQLPEVDNERHSTKLGVCPKNGTCGNFGLKF